MLTQSHAYSFFFQDEGKFDPNSIPLRSWNEYENELWDKESNHSVGSWVPPSKSAMMAESRAQSLYGRQTIYNEAPPSRQLSPSPSGYAQDPYANNNGRYSNYQQPYADNDHGSPGGRQSQYRGNSFYGGGMDHQQEYNNSQGGYRDDRPGSTYQQYHGGSPLAQPSPSRPESSFLPSMPSAAPLGIRDAPSDEELEQSVRAILDRSDLNLVTKKGVRKELEAEYGSDLSGRKDAINRYIEAALTGA